MDLSAFYGAFSPACFALLGLWLVAVQVRLPVWEKDPERRRRSYGVALYFALPGLMSMFALIDVQTPVFWRVSFGIVAVSGVVIMALVRGFPVAPRNDDTGRRALPGVDRLGLCEASPCRNAYLDTSTNRSRRYCSDRCATRANVAAYRARKRLEADRSDRTGLAADSAQRASANGER